MRDEPEAVPDSTAVRVALWRALHLEVDDPPAVFRDDVGLALARAAGFRTARHESSGALARRDFVGRTDGLRPPDPAEELLVAGT